MPDKTPKKTAKKRSAETLDFEAAMSELEALVETMEAGEISLDESLKLFERGITLTRNCQQSLKNAEQKVQILLDKNAQPEDFDSDDN